jgi:hypothetical protein
MGGACSAVGEERGMYRVLGGENLRERGQWKESGIDGRIIIRLIFRKLEGWGTG